MIRVLAAAALMAAGCSGTEVAGVSETVFMEVPGSYSSIEVNGKITVSVSPSYDEIEITSDVNVLPHIEIYLRGGALVVEYADGEYFSGSYETVVKIPENRDVNSVSLSNYAVFSMAELDRESWFDYDTYYFTADTRSEFHFTEFLVPSVTMQLENSSVFYAGNARIEDADLTLLSSSELMMDGQVQECYATISDYSELYPATDSYTGPFYLQINDFTGNISGSSDVCFHSDGRISGALSGRSELIYSGNANVSSLVPSSDSSISQIM